MKVPFEISERFDAGSELAENIEDKLILEMYQTVLKREAEGYRLIGIKSDKEAREIAFLFKRESETFNVEVSKCDSSES